MRRDLKELTTAVFDVAIVGGGITGACLAHQLAARGHTVALVEKGDFGGFTSSASSKLLHGGIRYLQELRPGKVRESARERAYFLNVAPHLTRHVPFLLPTYRGSLMRGRLALQSAMLAYEWLTSPENRRIEDSGRQVPRGAFLAREEAIARAPELDHPQLTGAQILYESQMISSERMTWAFLETAASRGTRLANYAQVDGFVVEDGRVRGLKVRDVAPGASKGSATLEIRAHLVANAAGPLVPLLNERLGGLGLARPTTGYSKGVHLVTRAINQDCALALVTGKRIQARVSRGGRHIFIIPWRGRSLIGTTDVPFDGSLDKVHPTATDVHDFLEDIATALPDARLTRDDVYFAYAGLYPLTATAIRSDTYQGHGDYQVLDHGEMNGLEGILTVLGAKYTTAPRVAELALELAEKKLQQTADASRSGAGTKRRTSGSVARDARPLLSAQYDDFETFLGDVVRRHSDSREADELDHLVRHYGCQTEALLERMRESPELGRRITETRPALEVEIEYAASEEMAVTLEDAVFRRTGLGTIGHPGPEALMCCAKRMARVHGWDEEQIRREIDQVEGRYVYAD